MEWLQAIDVAVLRFVNLRLSNPVLDWVLPFFSWNILFPPAVCVGAFYLAWKGGRRGRVLLGMLLLAIAVTDGLFIHFIKDWIGRLRPFESVLDLHVLVGKGGSGSMPSGHTANWSAATVIAAAFYRRSLWFFVPVTVVIGFSRVYLGVHYPSDVVAGAVLGPVSGWLVLYGGESLWTRFGARWFPMWFKRLPSFLNPEEGSVERGGDGGSGVLERAGEERALVWEGLGGERQWFRLGLVITVVLLLARLVYLASDKIDLSEDEAYQWLWSKHLDLSYYSKPPLIAYTQFLGTTLWGDTEFGVRFFAPVIAAVLSVVVLRFFAREGGARLGVAAVLMVSATPLMGVGSILLTIDPLSVLFWTLAMLSGWRAVRENSTEVWLWVGLWTGLGFLSKYTGLFQLLSWALFFLLWGPARGQLRRPGPYLALGVLGVCTLPVLIWNVGHGWITVRHLAERGGLDQEWRPTLRFFQDFVLAEFGLLNPVFAVGVAWAAIRFWRGSRKDGRMVFLFSMGAPLFLFYLFYTIRARVQPNWIAPAVLPLFCLAIYFWRERWGSGWVRRWFRVGVVMGLGVVVVLHDTNLVGKLAGRPLPAKLDPLVRVRGRAELARVVGEARRALEREEGVKVFVIGGHYGLAGLLSFYMPEAKTNVSESPLVYFRSSDIPLNQFYFWKGYGDRKGENAIFVQRTWDRQAPPESVQKEFASVTDLGMREIEYRGRVIQRVQLFACRKLL